MALYRGVAGLQGPDRRPRLDPDHPAPGCRRGAGRPDHGVGVRRGQLHVDQASRRHPQPLGSRAHAGWFLRRIGSGGGRRSHPAGQRWGRRRLHPHSGRLHRPVRAQVDLRAHSQGSPGPPAPADRGRGMRKPVGAGHSSLVRRLQRVRPPRHPEPAPGRRMGGRTGHVRPPWQAGGRCRRPGFGHRRTPWRGSGRRAGRGPHRLRRARPGRRRRPTSRR